MDKIVNEAVDELVEKAGENLYEAYIKKYENYDKKSAEKLASEINSELYEISEDLQVGEEYLKAVAKSANVDVHLVEDIGLDSMALLEILASTEKKYDISIPEIEFENLVTPMKVLETTVKYLEK